MKRSIKALLVAALCCLAVAVDARPRGVRLIDTSGFNGGKSQVGVNFLQIANDFAFMNAVKSQQNWGYVDNTSNPDPNELDNDGMPLPGANAFSHGGVYSKFFVPLQSERPGNYVATWDGISDLYTGMSATVLPTATFTGSVTAGILTAGAPSGGTIQKGMMISTLGGIIGDQITGSAGAAGTYFVTGLTTASSQSMTITGGSKTGSSATGNRYVFSTTAYAFLMGFTAATTTPSNYKVFHVDDEAEINAGEILGKKFRTEWAYMGNPGVIRFLDWIPGNTTSISTWATRKPVSYVSYQAQELRPSMWGGVTTNVGDAYTASITPSGWPGFVDKATIIVRFNATATTDAATLTVAGTTKNIRDRAGDATSTGNNTRPTSGRLGTLVYDQTLDCFIKIGGDLADGTTGLNNGVPPEVMLQVATKLGAHPWVPTPYLAADPLTDFMPSMAAYFRDNGPSWMIPRFEGPNELWNNAAGFYGTRYAWNKANVYWGVSNGHHQWMGKTMSVLGQAISTVYSGDRSRYWVIVGVQTGTACADGLPPCAVSGTSGSDQRLLSANWIASGPNEAPYSHAAGVGEAYRWVTHVAPANYVNGARYRTLQELRDGFDYVVTNAGNPTAQLALANSYANTLADNNPYYLTRMQRWYTWAQGPWGGSISLAMTAYEGGWTPDYSSTVWTSPVSGATAAASSVLKLLNTGNPGSSNITGNPAMVGMQLSFSGVRINGITQANPAVVTLNGSNLVKVGQTLTISGIATGSMAQANGSWLVTGVSGLDVTLSLDSSGFTAWSSTSPGSAAISGNFNITGVSGDNITTDLDGSSFPAWPSATVTLSLASPGVVNWTGHNRLVCDRVMISTTGTNPTGLESPNARVFVSNVVNANSFNVASSCGGTSINFTGSQSGTVTASASDWTASYVNSPLYTNTLRWASKFAPNLQTHMAQSYADLASIPLAFPSQFFFSGPSINNDNRLSGAVIGAGQVWGAYDQSVYALPRSTAVEAIRAFNLNFLLKRDVDPASNDNDPKFLEKAA